MAVDRTGISGPGREEDQAVSIGGLWWGVLLLVGGALWLGHTTGMFRVDPAVTAIVFAIAGAGFAYAYLRSPINWWAAIPAGACLGVAALIAVVEGLSVRGEWGASILLAGTGLGFGAAAVRDRLRSWVFVPAAVMFAVALIVAIVPLADRGTAIAAAVVGFLALAVAALALVPVKGTRMIWLLMPAAVLAVVAGFLAIDATAVLEPYNWMSPLAVVVFGVLVVIQTRSGRGAGR